MRCVILTASIGAGHDLPAEILRQELIERRPGAAVEVVDCLALAGGLVERAITSASFESPLANRLFFANQAAAQNRENGNANYIFDGQHIGSQVMRVNYQEQDSQIKQYRLDGKFELNENNRFAFGVETRDMDWHQRSSANQMAMGNWGAVDAGTPTDPAVTRRSIST